MGFPGSSAGKESAYNAGDSGSILGLEGSLGKEIGYPFPFSWASLVAQTGSWGLLCFLENQTPYWTFLLAVSVSQMILWIFLVIP